MPQPPTDSHNPKGAPGPARRLPLDDLAATAALAGHLATAVSAGDCLALSGDLGTGKTSFARALLAALGVDEEVPSPTFALVQTYQAGPLAVAHFDLYRLDDPDDVAELGFDDALDTGLVLVEWPDRLGAALPEDRLDICFTLADGVRMATLRPQGSWFHRLDGLPP